MKGNLKMINEMGEVFKRHQREKDEKVFGKMTSLKERFECKFYILKLKIKNKFNLTLYFIIYF